MTVVAAAGARRRGLLGAALVLVALNLRPAIAALSPVLSQVQRGDRLSSTLAGVLTADPVACFGIFAFATPRLIRRHGPDRLLWWTMAGLLVGTAVRYAPGTVAVFAGTTVIGASIGVANVVVPGIVKRDFADRVALMTALYATALSAGAALAAGVTVPIEHLGSLSWRGAAAVWGLVAVAALVVWPRGSRPPGAAGGGSARAGLWGSGLAWAVTCFMGLQSLSFYATFAWIPTIFESGGVPATAAGGYLALAGVAGIAGSLVTPPLARGATAGSARRPWVPVAVAVTLGAAGLSGLASAPTAAPAMWMVLLGLGQGASIALALGYLVLRAPDAARAGDLSTMAQGSGYLLAAAGPFGLGALHGATGGWAVPLAILAVLLLPELAAGVLASADRHVQPG